ncbi:AEC family transporter [Falsiroseomonas oryzae]|uniref:AEC family transporter n=1 Tax=Falsiroseomonas oryzae TaxID=2766473 RepID=UPI0022EB1D25|nr:AEC family transporter [Roseomonas sp. MO-31]
MSTILEVVAPVFALIALGYGAARWRFVDEAAFRALALFVFALAAPALLFSGGTRPSEGGAGAAVAIMAGSLLVYAASLLLGRRLLRMSLAEAGLFALACVFGNSVMMGIPVIIAAYGPAGVPPMLAIVGVQTIVLLGLATIVAEIGLAAAAPWGRVLRATVAGVGRNPVLISVVLAMLWNLFGLPVPDVLRRTLDLLGAASPPVALFCLGGSLFGLSAAALWKETALIAAIKLLLLPAVVFAVALLLPLTPAERAVAVTMAALPTGANAFILARRYETGADRSGSAVVLTTALSVLTLSVLIGHFRDTLP